MTRRPPSPRQYAEAAAALALSVVKTEPCLKCRWPKVEGRVCLTCEPGKGGE